MAVLLGGLALGSWHFSEGSPRALTLLVHDVTLSGWEEGESLILDRSEFFGLLRFPPGAQPLACPGCCLADGEQQVSPPASGLLTGVEPLYRARYSGCDLSLQFRGSAAAPALAFRLTSDTQDCVAKARFSYKLDEHERAESACPVDPDLPQEQLKQAIEQTRDQQGDVPEGAWVSLTARNKEPIVFVGSPRKFTDAALTIARPGRLTLDGEACEVAPEDAVELTSTSLQLMAATLTAEGLSLRLRGGSDLKVDAPGCAFDGADARRNRFFVYLWGSVTAVAAFLLSIKQLFEQSEPKCPPAEGASKKASG